MNQVALVEGETLSRDPFGPFLRWLCNGVAHPLVKATKRESWRDFVTEQAQSNMWGAAYRYHSQRITPAEAMNAVTAAGSPGLTWTSVAEILMDTLIRPDNPEDDTREQR